MKNNKKVINIAFLIISFAFLFNPNITVIDVLPDFVGYIFLCLAISGLADLNNHVSDAYNIFKRMIFIDAAKLLAIFWIFGMSVRGERNTSILLWTFVFSVIELICLIPAYSKLFNGIVQIGYRVPNKYIFSGKKSHVDTVKIITFLFITLKSVLGVLPEFADLTSRTYDDSFGNDMPILYDYIGIMRFLAFIPVLIIGIVWLIFMIRFFCGVYKDTLFMSSLDEKYRLEILPRKGLFIRRNFKTVQLIAIVAFCLTIDIRIDSYNVIPDFLAAAMFVVAFVFMQKYIDIKSKHWVISASAFAFSTVVASVIEGIFFTDYYYSAIIRSENAKNLYIIMVVANVLKALTMSMLLFDMYIMLKKVIVSHTGFVVGRKYDGVGEHRMIATQQNELKKSLIYANISAILYMISDICYDIFARYFGFMGIINICFAIVCIFMFGKTLFAIQASIDTKYMLE